MDLKMSAMGNCGEGVAWDGGEAGRVGVEALSGAGNKVAEARGGTVHKLAEVVFDEVCF